MSEHSESAGDFFDTEPELDALASVQGVHPVTTFDHLLGDFWPEDESVDDFIAAVRHWRRDQDQTSR